MKTIRCLLFSVLAAAATAAYAASIPAMEVTIATADGKLAHRGTTGPDGTFSSDVLQPGRYVVQLKSRSDAVVGHEYAVAASAGQKKVVAASVEGQRFTGGGVAMRISVARGQKITGQVATRSEMAARAGAHVATIRTGSHIIADLKGDIATAQNITVMTPEAVQRMQEGTLSAHRDFRR